MDEIAISFEGRRDAVAALTWPQRRTWRGSRLKYRPFVYAQKLPSGKTLSEVCATIKWAYEEFESLRTVFPLRADGEPYQKVEKAGSVKVPIIKAEESTIGVSIQDAISHFKRERFDTEAEFGVLFAVLVCADVPTHIICRCSHLAVDAHGCRALSAALDAHLSGKHDQSSTPPMQPIERAQLEQSENGQQKSARALEYWREVLEKFPQDDITSRSAAMVSPALGTAVSIISKKYGVSTSAVYLAAVSVVAGALIGRNKCSFLLAASNRFSAEERAFVGELVQSAPGILDSLDMPFNALLPGAWQASVRGYRFSHYDEQALLQLLDDLDENSERKRVFDFAFNDMRSSRKGENHKTLTDNLRDAMSLTQVEQRENLYEGPARFLSVALREDSRTISLVVHDLYFPEFPAHRILLAIEALVVGAAMEDAEPLEHPMRFTRNFLAQTVSSSR
ncbi:condensation domain-containing protein [Streptomyces sp. NPDC006335]|uniref:condensation domain-containing protein n=1 Tax=Streptomyces sp. NPDC006335 TaxID=3156895 RepID=UPI0033B898BA